MVSTLIDAVPVRVEVRCGLVYYHHPDVVYAQPIKDALVTAEMVQKAVREWQEGHTGHVVPLRPPGH